MLDKTPVTILQELCVANGSQPIFNLIHDGTGTLNPIFKYEVSVTIQGNHVRAVGTGRSKKEAKHDSARIALEKLSELSILPNNVPTTSETDLPRFVLSDAIRNLLELCEERKLPMPDYELIQDIGPPHAREFTIMCSVASLKQSAVATTKKAAKQLASSNMIDLLRTVENDEITGKEIVPVVKIDINKVLEERRDKIILTRKYQDHETPFKDYDQDMCDGARKILNDKTLSSEDKTRDAFKMLNIEYEIIEVPAKKQGHMFLLSTVQLEPEFAIAEYFLEDLYQNACELLKILLQ